MPLRELYIIPGAFCVLALALEYPYFFYFHLLLYGHGGLFRGCHGFETGYLQAPVLFALDLGAHYGHGKSTGLGVGHRFFYVCLVR